MSGRQPRFVGARLQSLFSLADSFQTLKTASSPGVPRNERLSAQSRSSNIPPGGEIPPVLTLSLPFQPPVLPTLLLAIPQISIFQVSYKFANSEGVRQVPTTEMVARHIDGTSSPLHISQTSHFSHAIRHEEQLSKSNDAWNRIVRHIA